MDARLCPPTVQSESNCNAVSVGSRKDWDEYLQKLLGQVTSAHPSSVVIEEIIESPIDPRSSDSGKRQVPPTIGGFAPLVLTLTAITRPTSPSVQEGAPIVPTIRGSNPLILPKPALGISKVSNSRQD